MIDGGKHGTRGSVQVCHSLGQLDGNSTHDAKGGFGHESTSCVHVYISIHDYNRLK